MKQPINLFWFRRDLRLHDNHGLFQALSAGLPVVPLFIYDSDILDRLEDRDDRRVTFIYTTTTAMQRQLEAVGSTLEVRYGKPVTVLAQLLKEYQVAAVFTNHDYEPYATTRDEAVARMLEAAGARLVTFKDQVIFERNEVVKADGKPYSIYGPYARRWRALLQPAHYQSHSSEKWEQHYYRQPKKGHPTLQSMNFVPHPAAPRFEGVKEAIIQHYHTTRDFPAVDGTTQLGLHLRFGTVSVRQLVQKARSLNDTFLGELVWREFFMQLLWHHPRLERECCKKEYEAIKWRNNEKEFERWCAGQTGYPLVDAGMRQLAATGFMHNRVRMVAASFLIKHLLVDWRLGEAYFGRLLLDYDLAANNGNWQWVAGCGCDAAPYFRVFNPAAQAQKFDRSNEYIRRWVPEWGTPAYPPPMVQHDVAQKRCLAAYKQALQQKYSAQ